MSEISLSACMFCGRHGTVVVSGRVTECTGCGITQIRTPDDLSAVECGWRCELCGRVHNAEESMEHCVCGDAADA